MGTWNIRGGTNRRIRKKWDETIGIDRKQK